MKITPELAKRIANRKQARRFLSEAQEMEVLMDWLEGIKYKDIIWKHNTSKSVVERIVREARAEAIVVLEKMAKSDKARAE